MLWPGGEINELSDLLELGEELTRPVRKLSLGQRMKAELAGGAAARAGGAVPR